MATWSGIRRKLECEYLADSLRGRVRYFATTYRESHDQEGRAAIIVDGTEVLKGNFYNYWLKNHLLPKDDTRYNSFEFDVMDETALELGMFDQRSFYRSFAEFDNQPIEKSLVSENLLVRIFAILDRRVGKRRLLALKHQMESEPEILQFFYYMRAEAENIVVPKSATKD